MSDWRPARAIETLGEDFYDPVAAANFPELTLRYADDVSATEMGLSEPDWLAHFGRFEPLSGSLPTPLAQRYHGHQFRHYNPDIGDGRGLLFGQAYDPAGRLMDFGTKGSGQTPWSRSGDGRLTLLGGVREVLATRYLEHLSVNTSRSFALIETHEELHRGDEPSPTRSAVLTRLSHSHIRFGTFQRQAFFGKIDNLERLVEYCRTHFYPDAARPADLLEQVAIRSADLVASWMVAGFVHGVMNTDNMNVTGESFDYGPYRFLPHYDPAFTAAYFDHNGLYAFARQPEAMGWNLAQLAQSLSLIEEDQALIDALDVFADQYQDRLTHYVFNRLGIERGAGEGDFIRATFDILKSSQTSWPHFWADWRGGAGRSDTDQSRAYAGQGWADWVKALAKFEALAAAPERPVATLFYDEIGELWAPIRDHNDWSAFENKLSTFDRRSFE